MTNNLWNKLLSILTGALLGYVWGWIWGWSLFDPNSDVWALSVCLGALIGLLIGATPLLGRYGTLLLCATFGLYLGWIGSTILWGDVVGGPGIVVMIVGAVVGGAIGLYLKRYPQNLILPILLGALTIGFVGGLLIDVILLDKILGVVKTHSILSQAPIVLACGLIGGIMVARQRRAMTRAVQQENQHEDRSAS